MKQCFNLLDTGKPIKLSERDLERLLHPELWAGADVILFTHAGPMRVTGPKENP